MLKSLFCNHDWEIVNETHNDVYFGPVDGWIKVKQSYLLYCTKCKKKKWFSEKETETIMNIKKIESKNKKQKRRN